MKPVIVYSALHTGTWFACHCINQSCREYTTLLVDNWFAQAKGVLLEDLYYPGLTHDFICRLIEEQRLAGHETNSAHEAAIIQAHQKTDSNLWRLLKRVKPEVPVIVPIRDPLLAINTRVWRDCKQLDNLQNEDLYTRKLRALDQFKQIRRILDIPTNHVFFMPIDQKRSETERIETFQRMTKYCNLTFTDEPEDGQNHVQEWKPVNSTKENFGSEFEFIKEAILNKDYNLVNQYLDIELQILKETLNNHILRLQILGYKDLLWWE